MSEEYERQLHAENLTLRAENAQLLTRIAECEARESAARIKYQSLADALDDILNRSAVITPHDANYKEDFVDIQVVAEYYEAGFELLKNL